MTWKDSLIDFTAGSVGGCSGKLLDYPLDTVKVRLQTQGAVTTEAVLTTTISAAAKSGKAAPPPIYYTGAIHCLQHTIRTDGYMSLYRGISAPLLGSMAENAVLFLVYSEIKKQMGETPGEPPLTLLQMCMAGGLAGGFTPFVLTPFELVKCRLQTVGQGFRTYKGPMDVVLQTIKEEGFFRGLYRGNMSTLLREIPGNFCWYGVYEGVCKLMTPEGGSKADLGVSAHLIGGAGAGVAYWTAFYPADTVKSLVQTHPEYLGKGFVESFLKIYRREGYRGLYKGWGITAARAAPAHATIFATYEYTMKLLKPEGYNRNSEKSFVMHESIRD